MHIVVPNLTSLYALQNHEEDELAYVEDTKQVFCWKENDWQEVKTKNKGLELNLYDLNKNIIDQMEPLTADELIEKIDLINGLRKKVKNQYYMLLCHEYRYYTIFARELNCKYNLGGIVIQLASALGNVYSIEEASGDTAIELWIKPNNYDSPLIFYLFPYDQGVVNFA